MIEDEAIVLFKEIVKAQCKLRDDYKGPPCIAIDIDYSMKLYRSINKLMSEYGVSPVMWDNVYDHLDSLCWRWWDDNCDEIYEEYSKQQ